MNRDISSYEKNVGKLRDASSIIDWQAREGAGTWTPELAKKWDLIGALLVEALDEAEKQMRIHRNQAPARRLVESVFGE